MESTLIQRIDKMTSEYYGSFIVQRIGMNKKVCSMFLACRSLSLNSFHKGDRYHILKFEKFPDTNAFRYFRGEYL